MSAPPVLMSHALCPYVQRAAIDRIVRPGAARYLAEHIAGGRLKLLPGEDHNLWAGDVGAVIDEVDGSWSADHRPMALGGAQPR